jgi:hypothetical protein
MTYMAAMETPAAIRRYSPPDFGGELVKEKQRDAEESKQHGRQIRAVILLRRNRADRITMKTGAVNCSTMALAAVVSLLASTKKVW